jgi:hypothetical protein
VLQRLPCTLEEEAVLRIHYRRLLRVEAEEGRVEHADVIEHGG